MAFAQLDFNPATIEISAGVPLITKPNEGLARSNYATFSNFSGGLRYMFNTNYGLKGNYTYTNFSDKDNSEFGNEHHRVSLEGVAQLGNLLNFHHSFRRHWGLLAHAGLGMTWASPEQITEYERIGNLIFGLTPEFKISEQFSIIGDASYIVNMSQNFGYDGTPVVSGSDHVTGSYFQMNIGVQWHFGNKKTAADWH
ncbi:MAG: hypothetical protein BM564_12950 [Bacteroidetes bacterium MedPE-SWsnd-G2]|nr:MAG: hypothetical protein BM564_12950 [Bacteroidetes bacterium MedPE-SWsnd-G2]